jgi:hypothetical protein
VTAGQIKRLLINMPPRYAKSTCVSIMWPTWVWAREPFPGKPHNPVLEGPGTKWVFASYADELRTKHSLDRRKLLQSEWYRTRWPKPAELTSDQNVKTLFSNSSSGVMLATTMLGAGTGLGGNCVVGETIVDTEIGPIRMDKLVSMRRIPRVLSYNLDTQSCEYQNVTATRTSYSADIVEVRTSERGRLRCTASHRIYTRDRGYVAARDCQPGQGLVLLREVPEPLHDQTMRLAKTHHSRCRDFLLRQTVRSSYRQESTGQPTREFSYSLSALPRATSQAGSIVGTSRTMTITKGWARSSRAR